MNTVEKILSYKSFEDNWDSYGAKSFSKSHLSTAINLYNILLDKFNINPIHVSPFNGGIMFEYTELPFILEVDVIHDGTYAYLQIENVDNTDSYKEAGNLTLEDLLSDIEYMLCNTN